MECRCSGWVCECGYWDEVEWILQKSSGRRGKNPARVGPRGGHCWARTALNGIALALRGEFLRDSPRRDRRLS